MGRRVAVGGIILVVVGAALTAWSQRRPQVRRSDPMDDLVNGLLGLLPTLGGLILWVGAVMVALGLAMRLMPGLVLHPASALLWAGLGSVLLGLLVETAAAAMVFGGWSTSLSMVFLATTALRILGAVLLAFWLAGRLGSSVSTPDQAVDAFRDGRVCGGAPAGN